MTKHYVKEETITRKKAPKYDGKALHEALDNVLGSLFTVMLLSVLLMGIAILIHEWIFAILAAITGIYCGFHVFGNMNLLRTNSQQTVKRQYVELPRRTHGRK